MRIRTKYKTLGLILIVMVATAAVVLTSNAATDFKSKQTQLQQEIKLEQIRQERQSQERDKATQDQVEQQKKDLQNQIDALKQQVDAKKASKLAEAAQAAQRAAASVLGHAQASGDTNAAKLFIYMHESGNNPGSINKSSGACGLGQALPCSKMPCNLSDYACQDSFFTSYMTSRYGSWENAQAFWLAHNWW